MSVCVWGGGEFVLVTQSKPLSERYTTERRIMEQKLGLADLNERTYGTLPSSHAYPSPTDKVVCVWQGVRGALHHSLLKQLPSSVGM